MFIIKSVFIHDMFMSVPGVLLVLLITRFDFL